MMGIISAVLPLAVRIITMFLDKNKADKETQAAWLKFVESASKQFTSSATLKSSYDAQKARMEQMEKETSNETHQ